MVRVGCGGLGGGAMGQEKGVTVTRIHPAIAAQAMAGMERLDPRGMTTPDDIKGMCEGGQCFALSGAADAVYVLVVKNGVAWVQAAKGAGQIDCTEALDAVLTEQARGLNALAMQTARPGLVRKLKKRGWAVTGWIMRKGLQ